MYFCTVKKGETMGKTIIERMSSINEKMQDDRGNLSVTAESMKKADQDISSLSKELDLTPMQVLILTAVMQKSHRRCIDGEVIADYLGMDYLKFLSYSKDMDVLKHKGYVRIDNDRHIVLPEEVLSSLTANHRVEPERTAGLDTASVLTRIRRKLSIRAESQLTTGEVICDIDFLMKENPETSIGGAYNKYLLGKVFIDRYERLVFAALLYRYYYEDDDMIGWHDLDDYFEDDELDELRGAYSVETMGLQKGGIIEYSGHDGMLTKEYFKVKDGILAEALADVGGLKRKKANVSAAKKIEAGSITKKELYYNPTEDRQVSLLSSLLEESRFASIRETMKAQKLRTGFNCLFYGSPGTGKTETAYQIARESGRDLFVVDISRIKSCWVGESEKNIKEVFAHYRDCVASGGTIPILLFNEADAIFGIRQEGAGRAVDKMENSIQNIILQEMEDLDGILIATTNLTSNLDKAFERRFLYKIRFEKPSLEAKSHIWKIMIPELTEAEVLQLASDFDFSGGQIENIARKRAVKTLISGEIPTFLQIREYCQEENIVEVTARRKIGF